MAYTCTQAKETDVEEVITQWAAHLDTSKVESLRRDLETDVEQLYLVRSNSSGAIEAVFDLRNVLNLFSKNLMIFFSPEVARNDGFLTESEVVSASKLLVTIFSEIVNLSRDQDLRTIKIRSHDRVLLACFFSFASYLSTSGGWKAKAYSNWIELEELSVAA